MVVPRVVSFTEMPIIRPSVNSEFISGWPHSVCVSQKCRSMCSGCGFSVMLENSMLSISVTVRRERVLEHPADLEILEIEPAARMARRAGLVGMIMPPEHAGENARRDGYNLVYHTLPMLPDGAGVAHGAR